MNKLDIVKYICDQKCVNIDEIISPICNHKNPKVKRTIYIALYLSGMSYGKIARLMWKDWTTIIKVIKKADIVYYQEARKFLYNLNVPMVKDIAKFAPKIPKY